MEGSMSTDELSRRLTGLESTLSDSGILRQEVLDEVHAIGESVISVSIGHSKLVENLANSLRNLANSSGQTYLFTRGNADIYERFSGEVKVVPESVVSEVLDMKIENVAELSVRARISLEKEGIRYVGEIFDGFTRFYIKEGGDGESYLRGCENMDARPAREIIDFFNKIGVPFLEESFLVGYQTPEERE